MKRQPQPEENKEPSLRPPHSLYTENKMQPVSPAQIPLPQTKKQRPRSHGISLVSDASKKNKQVKLYLGLADALYSSSLISQGITIGGLGPSYINSLCEITLLDKTTMKEVENAIAARFIDHIIQESKKDLLQNKKHLLKESDLHFCDSPFTTQSKATSTIPQLTRQAIRFSLKQKSQLQTKCQLKNPVSKKVINKLNGLIREDRTTAIDNINPQNPFDLCEELLQILIPKISLRKQHDSSIGPLKPAEFLTLLPQLSEFIVRTFFSATYLFAEASTSYQYLKKYNVTYVSDTTSTLAAIVSEGQQYELNLASMLKKAQALTEGGSTKDQVEINENKKDLLMSCEVNSRSVKDGLNESSSPLHFCKQQKPVSFILAHQLLSICQRPSENDPNISNLEYLQQKSAYQQLHTVETLRSLSYTLYPRHSDKISENKSIFTWTRLKEHVEDSPPHHNAELQVYRPNIANEEIKQGTAKLSKWIVRQAFVSNPSFTFEKADLTPLLKHFLNPTSQPSKRTSEPSIRVITSARDLILSAIEHRVEKVKNLTEKKNEQGQLADQTLVAQLELAKNLLNFPIKKQFKSNIKHLYNVTILVELINQITSQLHKPLEIHINSTIKIIKEKKRNAVKHGKLNLDILNKYTNKTSAAGCCFFRLFACAKNKTKNANPLQNIQTLLGNFSESAKTTKQIIHTLTSFIKKYKDFYNKSTNEKWKTDLSVIQIECFHVLFFSEVLEHILNKMETNINVKESIRQTIKPREVFDNCKELLQEHLDDQQSKTHHTRTIMAQLKNLTHIKTLKKGDTETIGNLKLITPNALAMLADVRETPFLVIQRSTFNFDFDEISNIFTQSPSPTPPPTLVPILSKSSSSSSEEKSTMPDFESKTSPLPFLKIGFNK
jgi:hypothetical protein